MEKIAIVQNMRLGNRWSIMIYALILVNFAVIIAYIIYANSQELAENTRYSDISTKMSKNIEELGRSSMDYAKSLNTNGSGFINTVACPTLTMSGTAGWSTYTDSVSTSAYFDGAKYSCSGSSVSYGNALLTYNSAYSSFSGITFRNSTVALTGGATMSGVLADSDLTKVSAPVGAMSNIDANANSDDERPYSTGTTAYPGGRTDDDDLARKVIFGYIRKNSGWRNVYWNNPAAMSYIRKNADNTGSLARFPDTTGTGYLYLDADSSFSLKIIEFDTGSYQASGELRMLNSTGADFPTGGIGYLQNSLTFANGTGSAKPFDLTNRDYGIFLSATGSSGQFLKYKLMISDVTWPFVYINPLDDSDPGLQKYFWSDILIDSENHFIGKTMEIIKNHW